MYFMLDGLILLHKSIAKDVSRIVFEGSIFWQHVKHLNSTTVLFDNKLSALVSQSIMSLLTTNTPVGHCIVIITPR